MKAKHIFLIGFELACLSMFCSNQKVIMHHVFAGLVLINPQGVLSPQPYGKPSDSRMAFVTKEEFAPVYVLPENGSYKGYIVPDWQKAGFTRNHPDYSFLIPQSTGKIPIQSGPDAIFKSEGWYDLKMNAAGLQEIESQRYADDGTWTTSWYEVIDEHKIRPLYYRGGLSPGKMLSLLVVSMALALSFHVCCSTLVNLVWRDQPDVHILARSANLKPESLKTPTKLMLAFIVTTFIPLAMAMFLASTFWSY